MEGFELKYSSNPFLSKGYHELLGIPVPNDCPTCPSCPTCPVNPPPAPVPKKKSNSSIIKKISDSIKLPSSTKQINKAFKDVNKKISKAFKLPSKKKRR